MLETIMCHLMKAVTVAWDNNLDNSLMEKLREGNWWDAITGVFGGPIGEFFIGILFLLGPAILYIKTQNTVPAGMAVLIEGAVFAALFTSPVRFFFAVVAIFGLAVVLYGVMKR